MKRSQYKSIKFAVGLFLLSTLALFMSNCSVNKQSISAIGDNDVFFVEYILTQEGQVVSGNPPQGMRIDGPMYRFVKETKQLDIKRNDGLIMDSIKVLVGSGKILKGAAGSGVSTRLAGINKLPYTENRFTLMNIDDKSIQFKFDNQKIKLKEGEDWKYTKTYIDTIKAEAISLISITSTYTVRYHGIINKRNITGI